MAVRVGVGPVGVNVGVRVGPVGVMVGVRVRVDVGRVAVRVRVRVRVRVAVAGMVGVMVRLAVGLGTLVSWNSSVRTISASGAGVSKKLAACCSTGWMRARSAKKTLRPVSLGICQVGRSLPSW